MDGRHQPDALFLLRRRHALADATQPRSQHLLHNQRRFWTLAIEEQLYLAYFLLLFLRVRWGWGVTIAVCLFARVGG